LAEWLTYPAMQRG